MWTFISGLDKLAAARHARVAPALFWQLIEALAEGESASGTSAEDLNGALMAGQALLETGLAVRPDLRRSLVDKREHVQRWMRHIVENGLMTPEDRLIAGDALAALGDNRPGVGVIDGVPDIEWCEIGDGDFLFGKDNAKCHLGGIRIAKYLVTNAQFKAFEDDPDGWGNDRWWRGLAADQADRVKQTPIFDIANRPRECVSWYAAVAFTRWLTARLRASGKLRSDEGVTLPTEQQWERAARGTGGFEFPWGNEYETGLANIDETRMADQVGSHYLAQTSAVGMYANGLSPSGLYDCAGNVSEWCRDNYRNPADLGLGGDARRVVRGGSWDSNRRGARCASRLNIYPSIRNSYLGFRCVVVSPFFPDN